MTQTILITGASSGIGLELTRQLAGRGDKILALARSVGKLQSLSGTFENVTPVPFDVGELNKIDTLLSSLVNSHPDLSILINNAGIQDNVRFDEPDYGAPNIANEIKVNLTAPICLSRSFLDACAKKDAVTIVNVTSGLAYMPKLTSAVYSATKSGLHMFSDALRAQLPAAKLTVSEVILPIVATPMTEGRGSGKISAEEAARQIIAGMDAGKDRIYVGKTKALPFLLKFAPAVARRIIQKPD